MSFLTHIHAKKRHISRKYQVLSKKKKQRNGGKDISRHWDLYDTAHYNEYIKDNKNGLCLEGNIIFMFGERRHTCECFVCGMWKEKGGLGKYDEQHRIIFSCFFSIFKIWRGTINSCVCQRSHDGLSLKILSPPVSTPIYDYEWCYMYFATQLNSKEAATIIRNLGPC